MFCVKSRQICVFLHFWTVAAKMLRSLTIRAPSLIRAKARVLSRAAHSLLPPALLPCVHLWLLPMLALVGGAAYTSYAPHKGRLTRHETNRGSSTALKQRGSYRGGRGGSAFAVV